MEYAIPLYRNMFKCGMYKECKIKLRILQISFSALNIQKRNTYILKRRFPVHPVNLNQDVEDRKLRPRHYIYDLVEDKFTGKKDPIKVLLIKPVDGVGLPGDIFEARPTLAREKLLTGDVVYASPENLEKYSYLRSAKGFDVPSSPFAYQTLKRLELSVFSVSMNMETPWQIEPWHIRVAFRKRGVVCKDSAITLPSQPLVGPDPNLEGKEFLVKVKINNKEEARVRFRLHHISTNLLHRLPWKENFWKYSASPIFQEDAEILADLNSKDPEIIQSDD